MEALGFSSPGQRSAEEKLDTFHGTPSIFLVQHRVADDFASKDWTIAKDGDAVDPGHPARRVWSKPNLRHSGYTYRYLVGAYRDLLGESFVEIVDETATDTDRPFSLRPLPPFDVTLRKGRQGGAQTIFAEVDGSQGGTRKLAWGEFLWSTFLPDLTDPYNRGRGLADVVSSEMEIDEFAAEYVRSFFHNDATPRGILTSTKKLSDDQRQRLKKRWNRENRSASRSHQTAVLTGSEVDYERISDDFGHLDITELRGFEADLIRKVYGVPPEIVGQTEDSNRAKARAARDHMARYTTRPRLNFHREEWQNKILPRFEDGDQLTLTHEDPRPANLEHRREIMKEHAAAFTVNEIREEAGKPPREGGDEYLRKPATVGVPAGETTSPDKGTDPQSLPDLTDAVEPVGGDDTVVRFPVEVTGKQSEQEAQEAARRASEAIQPSVAQDITTDEYQEATTDMAVVVAAQELGVDVRWDLMNPRVKEMVDDYETNRIVQITETQRENISDIVRQGFDAGLRGPEIAGQVEQHYDEELIPNRAETIARTEMGIASSRSAHAVHKTSGIVERQEWVATLDHRVRDEHEDLNGDVVGIDEQFTVEGHSAPHPHAFGVAELDINCRCAAVAKVPERSGSGWQETRKALWKQREATRQRLEKKFTVLWREVFRTQWTELVRPALADIFDEVQAA